MEDGELDTLLKAVAVMDVRADEALGLRGMAERIGVTTGGPIPLDEIGYEQYDEGELSQAFGGRCNPLHTLSVDGDWKYVTAVAGESIAASSIFNYRQQRVAAALLLTENADGERFAIFASEGMSDRLIVENPMRAEQLRNTFEWVARKPFPVAVQDSPYLWPIVNRTADGRTVLGILNLSTDTYEQFAILWGGTDVPRGVKWISDIGELEEIEFAVSETESSAVHVQLGLPMAPLDFAVLLVE